MPRPRTDSGRQISSPTNVAGVDFLPLDLSRYSDDQIVEGVAKARPDLILCLGRFIDGGLNDEQIVRAVCDAGGSGQAMRYARRCLGPMRRWANLQ